MEGSEAVNSYVHCVGEVDRRTNVVNGHIVQYNDLNNDENSKENKSNSLPSKTEPLK